MSHYIPISYKVITYFTLALPKQRFGASPVQRPGRKIFELPKNNKQGLDGIAPDGKAAHRPCYPKQIYRFGRGGRSK